MRVTHDSDAVSVWMVDGQPTRLVWDGHRYRVSDRPTLLASGEAWYSPGRELLEEAWRFQGTNADDGADVRMFEVRHVLGECWELLRAYE